MAQIPRTNLKGILVPTTHYSRSLEKKKISALIELEEEIKPMWLQYQMLTHKTLDDYFEENPGTRPSHMLDVIESFHRLTPMAQSLGGISFTCPCNVDFGVLPVAIEHCFLLSGIRSSRFQSTILSLSCQSVRPRKCLLPLNILTSVPGIRIRIRPVNGPGGIL
jgi:hypothetical protein